MSLRLALLSVSSLLLFSSPAPVFSGEATPADGLRPLALRPLPLGSLEPQGWLQAQLRIQASGLTGHLDEFWPDVQKSGWIGGSSEGWERHPYWLDGFIPLAFLLQDQVLIAKAKRHVDAVLERQQADGWLGPEKSATGNYKPRDPWPVFVMLKALLQYEEATGDQRIVPAMTRYFRVLDDQLSKRPLFEWNRMRWQDGALCVHWLHDRTHEPWLLSLAGKLSKQGFDWRKHFADLPFKAKVAKWEHESHVVNNAMGVKASGVWFRQTGDAGDRAAALVPMESLDRYHGQAAGHFSGDECFAGRMPSQGTETCAVVEYIYSVVVLASILGEPTLGDRLEALGYNSLPAPFKPDMWARQYVQQANQAVVQVTEKPIYTTNGKDANVYGLETNFGCCTANMHQGWPKFAAHLWMALPQGGLAALSYAPVKIAYKVNEVPVSVEVQTTYPFEEEVKIAVSVAKPVKFPLWLRVPAWARGATIAVGDAAAAPAAPGGFVPVEREWSGTTAVTLRLPMEIRLERRFEDAVTVHRGPLVFSLKIGEDWKKVAGEVPHADWEVHPTTPWNYALAIDAEHPEKSFEVVRDKVGTNPFDPAEAPIRLMAKGRRVPEWKLDRGAALAPPRSPVTSSEPLETLTLIPYGAAKLRITEFPVLAK